MANENSSQLVNILLSRDELLLVLSLLEAQYIPGLDIDPLGERSAEQQDLAFVVAARGLRARDLARVRADAQDGRLVIHVGLLAAVSACAYSSNAAFVYHWPSQAEIPLRVFGHVRDGSFVVHTPVEDVLHLFTMLPSKEHLVDQVLAACHPADAPATVSGELYVPGSDFAQLRLLAEQRNLDQARTLLSSDPASADLVTALIETLSNHPQVSIVQTLKQVDAGAVLKRDFTLLQDASAMWLVAPTTADGNVLLVKPATRETARALILESI